MITDEEKAAVRGWFSGRLPKEWTVEPPRVTIDREEITVVLSTDDVTENSEVATAEARAGRARAFREDTREARMKIAREAQHRFQRKVSWGLRVGDHEELWTHVSAPVMTRLRQPQRQVLDTLVEAGVARSRSDALAWCVRLVGQHEEDWLAELREAMTAVDDVRRKGPVA
jgi:Arc/MetJ-type ribon-helix-helix transcriptional regulator